MQLLSRFWAKVAKRSDTECWLWTAACTAQGFGDFSYKSKHSKAHRIAWILTFGPIPQGRYVLQKCLNRRCVNPFHLILGNMSLTSRSPSLQDVSQRFWSKVDVRATNQCWLWLPYQRNGEYGVFKYQGRDQKAHRVAWMLHHQEEIPDGLVIRHQCDTPRCCNPGHLLLGTRKDNSDDKVSRNRQPKGNKIVTTKLTPEKVLQIRSLLDNRLSQVAIAKQFGVGKSTIGAIASRQTWKYI